MSRSYFKVNVTAGELSLVPAIYIYSSGAKILWDLLIQTDKQVLAKQADIVVMEKEQKTVMIELVFP